MNARKAAASLLLLLSATFCNNGAIAETRRMLCIGNSFSANAVETYLYPLMRAGGFDIEITNLYKAAASLEIAWSSFENDEAVYQIRQITDGNRKMIDDISVRDALESGRWDIVTVQQASVYSGDYTTYAPARQLIEAITTSQPEAEIWYHQTWSYSSAYNEKGFAPYNYSPEDMYTAICEAGKEFMADYTLAGIIPAGTAVMNARNRTGDRKELCVDGAHLTPFGQLVVACTWYESLTGEDVRENTYFPKGYSKESVELAREMAHAACLSPFRCTVGKERQANFKSRYNLFTFDGKIIFRPATAASHHIEIFTPSGERIYEADSTESVEIKVDKGLYIVVIDREKSVKILA